MKNNDEQRRYGWFRFEGQDGDRELHDQLKGLDFLWPAVNDASVLDLGCAEGLISGECIRRGARVVHGWEVVREHVNIARSLHLGMPVDFSVVDLNETHTVIEKFESMRDGWDVCLMLAILHKLRAPLHFIEIMMEHWRASMIVVRLPKETPGFVLDSRSGNKEHDIDAAIRRYGYHRTHVTVGHFDEWVGYFERY